MSDGRGTKLVPARNSYLDFYEENYGEYLVEKRLVEGRDMVGMFMCKQPAGSFPDDGIGEFNIQIGVGGPIRGKIDLGPAEFETVIRKGEFVVVPPDAPASFELADPHSIMGIGLPKAYFEAALRDLNTPDFSVEPLMSAVHKDPAIARLAQDAWSEAMTGGDLGALYVDTTILAMVARIVALATKAQQQDETAERELSDAAFQLVSDYVDSNVDTAIRMKTLANLTHLGEYEFARQFRKRTGLPPYQWVIERRLRKAEELLRGSDLQLADIAYACGFSSQAHMTSLFSKKRGATPLELRRSAQA